MRLRFAMPATAALAALAACADGPTASPVAPEAAGPGARYIVVMKEPEKLAPSLVVSVDELAREARARPEHVYRYALHGFAAELSAAQVAALRDDPRVAYVERDAPVRAFATQSSAPWGLDRIDQRARPLNGTYTYTPTGSGVNAYIIDTGILTTHTQFGGRALAGYSAISDGRGSTDCNGHGTHVAGTVGGSTYGVAKGVRLYAVRVLDCSGNGTTSGVIAGIDWVAQNRALPAVANMSLGGGASQAVDDAINRLVGAGVTVVVAAGNEGQNACNVSPARAASAITVGATTSTDARASYSNWGSCLDLFAPGSSIASAWHTSTSATATISGTSMASPHVAGVAALYLQGSPGAAAATVAGAIVSTSTPGVVTGAGTGSPNRLLFAPLTASGGGTPGGGTGASYSGTLTGSGVSAYAPGTGGYTAAASGTHSATLAGPASADFDLYLQKRNGSTWTTVARSESYTSSESVTYSGTAGTYRWRVYSYRGSGAFTLGTTRP